jgi:ribonuclease P protein component
VLPAPFRLRRRRDFAGALRGGRAGLPSLVVHLRRPGDAAPGGRQRVTQPRVGLIVARSVGPAVVRNRVKRRLRTLLRARLSVLPAGCLLVVRALPPAGSAPYSMLAADLDAALARLGVRTGRPA